MHSELFETAIRSAPDYDNTLFESVLREAESANEKWTEIRDVLRRNTTPIPKVAYNRENFDKYLGGIIETGYDNIRVVAATRRNANEDLFEKLAKRTPDRNLSAGRTILIKAIKECLTAPVLVIEDHDENRRPGISFIRSYEYWNDKDQICRKPLKVVVRDNVIISSYFQDYENLRKTIFDGANILKRLDIRMEHH